MLPAKWDEYLRKNLPKVEAPIREYDITDVDEWVKGFDSGYGDAEYGITRQTDERLSCQSSAYRRGYHDGWYRWQSTEGAVQRAIQCVQEENNI